uniref:pirin-like C-terminal cupin domain-containing protein n=1 Tax=Pseudomonas viridiflava TaxID=33069 RepID=UPI0019805673
DLPNQAGKIELIDGNYQGVKANVNTCSPIHVYHARLNKGGKAHFSFPENFNTGFMVIEGAIKVNESKKADVNHFVYFENTGTAIEIEA